VKNHRAVLVRENNTAYNETCTSEIGGKMKILQGISTTTFVATRVAVIVGAGLFVIGAASQIVDRFTGNENVTVEAEPQNESTPEV
jgi:hypothetical protein